MASKFDLLEVEETLNQTEVLVATLRGRVIVRLEDILGRGPVVIPTLTPDLQCDLIVVKDFLGADIVQNILRRLCLGLQGVFSGIDDLLQGLFNAITDQVKNVIGDIGDAVNLLVDKITETLGGVIDGILDKMDEIVTRIVSAISELVDSVVDGIRDIGNQIAASLNQVLTEVADIFDRIVNKIGELLDGITDNVNAVITTIGVKVKEIFQVIAQSVEDTLIRMTDLIHSVLDPLISGAEGVLRAIERTIGDIPGTIKAVSAQWVGLVEKGFIEPFSNIGTLLFEQVDQAIDDLLKSDGTNVESVIGKLMDNIGVPADAKEKVARMIEGVTPDKQFITAAVIMALLPMIVGPLVSSITGPIFEEVVQDVRRQVRPTLYPVPDALDALFRKEITEAEYLAQMLQHGYHNDKSRIIAKIRKRHLGPGDLTSMWLRGIKTETELDEGLLANRFRPEDLADIKEAAFFIPGAADQIQFAVREVFSPGIRDEFGLDQDLPPEFIENAAKIGLSAEWAGNFWASHWILPSVRMGFEMFHRGFINEDQLDLLLRTKDIMPFWRDNIKKIAFRRITRVDIRRFHKLGIMDEAEVKRRYKDLGLSDTDADRMLEFTIAFNSSDEPEGEAEAAGFTKTITLGLMEDGIITDADAVNILKEIGYSDSLASVLVSQRELQVEQVDRKEATDLIVNKVKSGEFTFEQAQDALGSLGLEAAELSKAITKLNRDLQKRPKSPSVEQLTKMLKKDIIKENDYTTALELSGYSKTWAGRLLELAKAG